MTAQTAPQTTKEQILSEIKVRFVEVHVDPAESHWPFKGSIEDLLQQHARQIARAPKTAEVEFINFVQTPDGKNDIWAGIYKVTFPVKFCWQGKIK